ncbi:hypothetical protein EOM39_01250 [Candidatus Gracilibacteria bacterium]|nr:hypothetical protein [Candidatus Gracilibacteria bacterium]
MNDHNLVSLATRSKQERTEIGRKGAEATNRIKRQKKTFAEISQQLLDMKVKNDKLRDIVKIFFPDIEDDEITAKMVMIARQYEKAVKKGDTRAFEVIRDTAGEKPTEKIENTTEMTIKGQDVVEFTKELRESLRGE